MLVDFDLCVCTCVLVCETTVSGDREESRVPSVICRGLRIRHWSGK